MCTNVYNLFVSLGNSMLWVIMTHCHRCLTSVSCFKTTTIRHYVIDDVVMKHGWRQVTVCVCVCVYVLVCVYACVYICIREGCMFWLCLRLCVCLSLCLSGVLRSCISLSIRPSVRPSVRTCGRPDILIEALSQVPEVAICTLLSSIIIIRKAIVIDYRNTYDSLPTIALWRLVASAVWLSTVSVSIDNWLIYFELMAALRNLSETSARTTPHTQSTHTQSTHTQSTNTLHGWYSDWMLIRVTLKRQAWASRVPFLLWLKMFSRQIC